jgi:hypothetical protein
MKRPSLAEQIKRVLELLAELTVRVGKLERPQEVPAGWIDLKTAAVEAGVSVEALRRRIIRKKLPARLVGGCYWVPPPELESVGTPTPARRRRAG